MGVTGPVEPLGDPKMLGRRDREDFVPRGRYVAVADLAAVDAEPIVSMAEPDALLFNLDDPRSTRLGGVLAGCCGIDGCDGVNTFCLNGHALGTERSDCWMVRFIHIPRRNLRPAPASTRIPD